MTNQVTLKPVDKQEIMTAINVLTKAIREGNGVVSTPTQVHVVADDGIAYGYDFRDEEFFIYDEENNLYRRFGDDENNNLPELLKYVGYILAETTIAHLDEIECYDEDELEDDYILDTYTGEDYTVENLREDVEGIMYDFRDVVDVNSELYSSLVDNIFLSF